jgi:exonuclease III
VRGLHTRAHRDAVRELVRAELISFVYLQETKMDAFSDFDIMQLLGSGFEYSYLPAAQTRGGVLLAWRSSSWTVSCSSVRRFSVSAKVKPAAGGAEWWLSSVYGPSRDEEKPDFLNELNDLRLSHAGPWLLCGDFNMIYRTMDKNNNRVDRRRMGQFRRFLSVASLKEIHLQERLFTWSNERDHPTMEKLDRFFVMAEWEVMHQNFELHSLASLCSDHAPLILGLDMSLTDAKRFMFQSSWPKFSGFREVVAAAWRCPLRRATPFKRLDWCLRNTVRALQSWSAKSIGSIRLQLEIAKEILHRLRLLEITESCLRRRKSYANL